MVDTTKGFFFMDESEPTCECGCTQANHIGGRLGCFRARHNCEAYTEVNSGNLPSEASGRDNPAA
jgi:hypothetical protein